MPGVLTRCSETERSRRRRGLLAAITGLASLTFGAAVVASPAVTTIEMPASAVQHAERGRQVQVVKPPPAAAARYRVTVVQEWSPQTHPSTLPPNWHTSPAVLAAHGRVGDMFAAGGQASPGIESMAETGGTSQLRAELSSNPTVADVATGRRIDGVGSAALEVTATTAASMLSLTTMLAPSPDWFVGLSSVELLRDGAWTGRIVLDLANFDAGTDSGATFTSANADTQPRQPVAGPRDATFAAAAAEGRFGYVVIERIG